MKSKDEGQVNRIYKAQEMANDTNYKNVLIKSVLQAYQRTTKRLKILKNGL